MKLTKGTFHVNVGPINKMQGRKWKTYKQGDEVDPSDVVQLQSKGAVLEESQVIEDKPKVQDNVFQKELVEINGVGPKSAKKIAKNYSDAKTLVKALIDEKEKLKRELPDNVVEALEKNYLTGF